VRRNAAEIRVRTGFRTDGAVTFREIDANYLLGAYADISDRVAGYSAMATAAALRKCD